MQAQSRFATHTRNIPELYTFRERTPTTLQASSHRFSAQERPIQYGSEGLDSIEHLELITRVNKCGETQMDE